MATSNSHMVPLGFLSLMFGEEIPKTLPLDEHGRAREQDVRTEINRLWNQAMNDIKEI